MLNTGTGEIIPLPVAVESVSDLWLDRYPNGLILTQYAPDGSTSAWVKLDDSQTFSELPDNADTSCTLLLADGSVICQSYTSEAIYRYEPASGALTKLTDLSIYLLDMRR